MSTHHGVFRLGGDAKVNSSATGTFVSLSLADDYFDGKTKQTETQWISAKFSGERAEKLALHLKKGGLVEATLDNLHVATFTGKDGKEGYGLNAGVIKLDFVGGKKGAGKDNPGKADHEDGN